MNAILQPVTAETAETGETAASPLTKALRDVPSVGDAHYHLAGLDWQHEPHKCFGDSLTHRRPLTHEELRIKAPDRLDAWTWRWTRIINPRTAADDDHDEFAAHYDGAAHSLKHAAAEARDFCPLTRPDYPLWLGVPSANGRDWFAVLDGDRCTIWQQQDGSFYWRRAHNPAAHLGRLFGGFVLQGETADLACAILACEHSVTELRTAAELYLRDSKDRHA